MLTRLLLFALIIIANFPGTVFAGPDRCPSDAIEIGRKEFDRKIVLTCRCGNGLWFRGGRCVPLKEVQEEFRLSAQGVLGEALKEADELQRYALSKNWSAEALNAFLLSTLSASRAKFDRAKRYLTLNLAPLSDDRIVAAFVKLLESKDNEMQLQRSVDSQVEAMIRDLDGRQQANALRDIIDASILRGQGRLDEAIVKYEQARSAVPPESAEMLNVLNETIAITKSVRAQMDYKLAPEQWDKYYRRARERASAEPAWTLALALNEAGLKKQSVELYKDAIASMQTMRPELVKSLSRDMDAAASRTQTSSDLWRRFYKSGTYTRNDALFDALDYGKGDWHRSANFLARAIEMDPTNEKFQYALTIRFGSAWSRA